VNTWGDTDRERAANAAVQAATPTIVAALKRWGVTGLQFFLAFGGEPVIWLVTSTDAEKNDVANHGFFVGEVRTLLLEAGLAPELATRASVTVESQETVDRDYESSWFSAMR
jgi:hypothetical protein